MKTIVLTGGGTAGHVMPHIAILPELEKSFQSIFYIGSHSGIEKKIIENYNIPYYGISTVKFKRKLSKELFLIPSKLKISINEAYNILKNLNPNIVFSKGGYVGLPVVLAARKLKIPIIIHESDFSPGLANKISSYFSCASLTSFYSTSKKIKKGIFTGPPVRENILNGNKVISSQILNISLERPILLVIGGSTGSTYINHIIRENLNELLSKFNILHICGRNNLSGIKQKGYIEVEFADMKHCLSLADIALSRSGSNTAFELILKKIPTLFIPLPKGISRGDQILNAKYFFSLGLCEYIEQNEFNSKYIVDKLFLLFQNRKKYIDTINGSNIKIGNDSIMKNIIKYSLS